LGVVQYAANLNYSASTLNVATVDAALAATLAAAPSRRQTTVKQQYLQSVYAANAGQGNQRSFDRYSSLDSSDTFLSCNTHPFPSQGSLAGLEELAAKGSMAANGSMPMVNFAGLNDGRRRRRRSSGHGANDASTINGSSKVTTAATTETNSATASGRSPSAGRRVRIASSRSASSDNELDVWADCLEETSGMEAPKHKRARVSQVRTMLYSLGQFV
jgi:hypothetical protein